MLHPALVMWIKELERAVRPHCECHRRKSGNRCILLSHHHPVITTSSAWSPRVPFFLVFFCTAGQLGRDHDALAVGATHATAARRLGAGRHRLAPADFGCQGHQNLTHWQFVNCFAIFSTGSRVLLRLFAPLLSLSLAPPHAHSLFFLLYPFDSLSSFM